MCGGEKDDKGDKETEAFGGKDTARWEVTFPGVQETSKEGAACSEVRESKLLSYYIWKAKAKCL